MNVTKRIVLPQPPQAISRFEFHRRPEVSRASVCPTTLLGQQQARYRFAGAVLGIRLLHNERRKRTIPFTSSQPV
jgi:hypothetical protein